jgi:hypothetical protein
MKLMPVQIPAGLERNGSPYDTPRSFWDCNLMRWQSDSARPIGGWVRKTEAPLADAIRRIFTWRTNDDTPSTLVGTETKLYADFAGGWLDITPSGIVPPVITLAGGYGTGPYGMDNYGTPRAPGVSTAYAPSYALWSFSNWGEDVLLLSSRDNRLFHYIAATPDVAPIVIPNSTVSGAPPMPLANAVAVTDERHVMIVGPTIGGVYYPHRVAWASRETLDDWDFSSVTNTAGFLDLKCTSPLNFIVNVREGVLLFTQTEVFLGTYVASPYIYGFQKIGEMPMYHPYSVATFGGQAMWLSMRAAHVYGSGVVNPIKCPLYNDVVIDFSQTWGRYRTHASSNGRYPEIWMFWPSLNAIECDRYMIYNYLEGWWAWGYLSRSAMVGSGPLRLPLMGDATGTIFEHENGWTNAGIPILGNRWLETGALGISPGSNVVDIKQALLATDERKQSVKLQFYGQYAPDGNERVFGPYTPRLDGYTDVRVNAREARVRYVGNVDDIFEVGLLRLDVSGGGNR